MVWINERSGRASALVQISAKDLGGLVIGDDVVTSAAPIIAYMAKRR